METVVEVFIEYRLAHPHTPHLFALPRLMNHLWRSQLSKDADVWFTINMEPSFWPCYMHEPLIVLMFLPLAYVSNYRGPWVIRGSYPALEVQKHMEAGFKNPDLHGCGKFHDLEGPVHGVRYPKEECSRDLMLKFIEAQKKIPPVSCSLVRRMLPPSPRGPLSSTDKSCRRRQQKRRPGYRGTPQQALPDRNIWISLFGNHVWMWSVSV